MISLCMIVKNEAANLTRCLNSVKHCVDEMIIVDTGSNDDTVQLAKEAGAKVYHYQWTDDFAAARNFSLDQATGDWVFYLDADEELEPNCCRRFRSLTANSQVEGYLFQINNLTDTKDNLRHINLRLFRNNPAYRFAGRLHEQILTTIRANKPEALVENSGLNIFHYGYLSAVFFGKNKAQRNFRLNQLMVQSEPDNPFYLHALGNSYVNRQDLKNAYRCYKKALEHVDLKGNYAPSLFIAHISCLLKLRKLAEAKKYIQLCQEHYPDYVDIYFLAGEFYSRLGHLHQSRLCFERCLKLGEQSTGKYTTNTGVGSFLAHFALAQIHQSLGEPDQAVFHQIQGLKIKNGDINHFITLAHLLKTLIKKPSQVLNVLTGVMKNPDQAADRLLLSRLLYEIDESELCLKILAQIDQDLSEVHYLKGLAYMKTARFAEAIEALQQIPPTTPLYQLALPELIMAHWLTIPSRDAALLIDPDQISDPDTYGVFKLINAKLFDHDVSPDGFNPNPHFEQITGRILELKQPELITKILLAFGLSTPDEQIIYLINPPVSKNKIELAAKLALQEIKKGINVPDYNYVLAWYFFLNDELAIAQDLLNQVLTVNQEELRYRQLLKDIYRKQSLKIILAALEKFPENNQFIDYLMELQQDTFPLTSLKGVH